VCTILVLDDDASIRFLYEEELRDEGYDVVSENGEACIEDLVLRKRPDLKVKIRKIISSAN
jgi:CheY-like chemotaxis protein